MVRHILLAALVASTAGNLPVATAHHDDTPEPDLAPYQLAFPVVGEHHYADTWHASRDGGSRLHLGTDIMAEKMTPVVAVADGAVGWMHDSPDGPCCAMEIVHDDGWASRYIHLNNDTPGSDDGQGWGFASGIEPGAHVTAGQHIGWVGDSGNAEDGPSHLHFELHHPELGPVNPYPHLARAPVLRAPRAPQRHGPCPAERSCDTVALVDAGARYRVLGELDVAGEAGDFYFGNPGDIPLMGDWDCDGLATPAMYRPDNGFMYLRDENAAGVADLEYFYGDPGDVPLAGDWDGDGCDTLAVYRVTHGEVHVRNSLGTGVADFSYYFGNPGDRPFAGDFDGDGVDTVGLYRAETGFVYFRNSHSPGQADLAFYYGNPGDRIVAGDWDGDGDDTVAAYRSTDGTLYLNMENEPGAADVTLMVGDGWGAALAVSGRLKAVVVPLEIVHSQGGVDYVAWGRDDELATCLAEGIGVARAAADLPPLRPSAPLGDALAGWLDVAMESGMPPGEEEVAAAVAATVGPGATFSVEVRPGSSASYLPDAGERCRDHDPTGEGEWAWPPLLDARGGSLGVAAFTGVTADDPALILPGYAYVVVPDGALNTGDGGAG